MRVRDVMTTEVAAVAAEASVEEVAQFLLDRHISAAPVVDGAGDLVGIVSEGDLIRRPETGTERHRSWWLALLTSPEELAGEYVKSHGHRASDVMTGDVIKAHEDMLLGELATLLEKNHIKRAPVMRDGKLVGIVSRADILRALAATRTSPPPAPSADDRSIREQLLAALAKEGLPRGPQVNVVVSEGVVHLWGLVESEDERKALHVAAESITGVRAIEDHLGKRPRYIAGM